MTLEKYVQFQRRDLVRTINKNQLFCVDDRQKKLLAVISIKLVKTWQF